MSPVLIERLRRLGSTARRFGAGAFLFHRDDPVRTLFVIEAGEAQLLRRQVAGGALILQRAGPGALLAEASLFSDRYHCDAVAAVPTRALALPAAAVRSALAQDAALAEAWAAHLARQLQAARLRAEILALRTVAERLEAWLAWHDGALPAKGTWRTLAGELGVSPEALYRELARRRGAR